MTPAWRCDMCGICYPTKDAAAACEAACAAAEREVSEPRDETAPTWTFTAPIVARSQNALYGRHRDHRAHRAAYSKMRDTARTAFLVMMRAHGIPRATGPRRITWTRILGYRERLFDHANLIGGLKPVVDAAVTEGLLVDDQPAMYGGQYLQVDDDRTAGPALRVAIWEGLE